jgi:hypothetical protein
MLRQLLARAGLLERNAPGSDSDEPGGEEFKLPKMASLVIVIAYNTMLQVRSTYAIAVRGSMA